MRKVSYKNIDFLRVVSCLAVLFYHLHIVQGGYLAVCTFFVLSGYFSCRSLFQKEKVSLIDYYKKRIIKIYLPLFLVIFLSIAVISFLPNISWLNLKPETTSILLGYNNFWQLGANLDYFARHVNSPFMHLWYISILLQFDLVLPFIYLGLKKLGDSVHKLLPCLITILLTLLSGGFFYYMSKTGNIMVPYYHTLSRVFSLLLGVLVAFYHHYYSPLVFSKLQKGKGRVIIFSIYFLVMVSLFFLVDAQSIYYPISMILTTVISARLIDYGVVESFSSSWWSRILGAFSRITYEVYLVQYPIIFVLQSLEISPSLMIVLVFILTFVFAFLLHFALHKGKCAILRKIVLVTLICFSFYGVYQYVISEDHTQEMKALEDTLAENQEFIQAKNEAYLLHQKEEEEQVMAALKELEMSDEALHELVSSLPIVGVGDSVMLGAVPSLYEVFPNGYFDAKVSRTAWVVNGILKDLKAKNMLGNIIVLNLGANGDCSTSCKEDIMTTVEDRQVFWVNVTNNKDVHVNEGLLEFANTHKNLHVVDWNKESSGHPEYFVADGIHLTSVGMKVYADFIHQTIYDYYQQDINEKKEAINKEYEESLKDSICFYGNDLLVNLSLLLTESFPEARLVADKEFTFSSFKEQLVQLKEEGTLSKRIVFAFDSSLRFSVSEYQDLLDLLSDCDVSILVINEEQRKTLSLVSGKFTTFSFEDEILNHKNYLMADHVHFTSEGNQALAKMFHDTLLEK